MKDRIIQLRLIAWLIIALGFILLFGEVIYV
jgi:hypothetical protein